MKKDYKKARDLLENVFGTYIDSNRELKIKDEIINNILSEYRDENMNISLFVKDCSVSDWQPKEHFSKIYYDEIKYIKNIYGITKGENNLLLSLSPYLMWETNLLVDEDSGSPLTQKEIIEKLGISKPTMINNMKGLYEKKIVCPITFKGNKYFIVNPYIMYSGKRIDKFIVDIFKIIGYINRGNYENIQRNK